jgi:ATP/ADP translocase
MIGNNESLKFLLTSRIVRDLATLVGAYGISISLLKVTSKQRAQWPSPNEYSVGFLPMRKNCYPYRNVAKIVIFCKYG